MKPEQMIKNAMIEHGSPSWVAYVPQSVRKQVPAQVIDDLRKSFAGVSGSVANRRDTKHDLIERWCLENVFAIVTLAELAHIGNCSKEFVRQKTIDRPDIFRRVSRSSYEIRDPKEDRRH